MKLTKRSVLDALERPMEEVSPGEWACRICGATYARPNLVGVHELTHRRDVGLAPPARRGPDGKRPTTIVCGYDGCPTRVGWNTLTMHMRGKTIHALDMAEASFYVAERRAQVLAEQNGARPMLPAIVEEEETRPPPPPVLTDLAAAEAVTGILRAARSDGLLPTKLLPAAYELIRHTDAVLSELRRLTDGH